MNPREEMTVEVICTRCQGTSWIPVPYIPLTNRGLPTGPRRDLREPDGYCCQRCVKVLRGDTDVKDPVASAAQQAAGERRRIAMTSQQNSPGAARATREGSTHGPR